MNLEHVYEITMIFKNEYSEQEKTLVFRIVPEDAGGFVDFMTLLENHWEKENLYYVEVESISKTYLD